MERLSEFRPIASCELPDVGELDTSGLIVVVGPNSSGKSQFLQDIYRRLCGEPRQLVVATALTLRKPALAPFLECLEREGYLFRIVDESGAHQYRPLTTFLGSGQAAPQIAGAQPDDWHRGFLPEDGASYKRKSEFLSYFGRLLVTGLFLDRRLTSLGQVGVFDFEMQPPQHDLHALYIDEKAKGQLRDEIVTTFNKAIWVDASKANVLCLRVSDGSRVPSPEDRLVPTKMVTYRTIDSEGDGLKSYVATCIALLLGRRPICVLDEPEMCLHPPQAYNLGRFIGRYGASADTCTFVATHSSHVLRGIVQTTPKLQILRLTRSQGAFHAHRVDAAALSEALAKPTVRSESILDGIFAQGVVVVEADTDRIVYQAVWETLQDELGLDIHFATVGGTGGIADTVRLYRTLRIPVAVLADLDLLVDSQKLGAILGQLTEATTAATLAARASAVAAQVKAFPPTLSPDQLAQELAETAALPTNWSTRDDEAIRRRLANIGQSLDRMRRLKRGGLGALPIPLRSQVAELLEALATSGLFLVPVGEVEGWLGHLGVTSSREHKWAWANEAAQVVRRSGPQDVDVWSFMRRLGATLT